ncbi:hypothetical protein MLGJGCBP_05060 [Rhodococcus sp. T7]|nr:hypothetical protein MLGJGCBP_05060 [Rhodococcus sp. T7]
MDQRTRFGCLSRDHPGGHVGLGYWTGVRFGTAQPESGVGGLTLRPRGRPITLGTVTKSRWRRNIGCTHLETGGIRVPRRYVHRPHTIIPDAPLRHIGQERRRRHCRSDSRYRMLAVAATNRSSGAFGGRGLAPALAKARVARRSSPEAMSMRKDRSNSPSGRRTRIHCPNGIRKACAGPAVARSCAAPARHHALRSTYAATTDPTTAPP